MPVYSCYNSLMMRPGNEPPVAENDPSQRILGWSVTSRAILVALCFAGSSALLWSTGRVEGPKAPDVRLVVDPNDTPPAVLLALPRLGPALVGRIVVQREIELFQSLDDLDQRVKGIGPATIKSIRPYLRVESRDSRMSHLAASPSLDTSK